jgi:alanyl-tRNA synthetase
MTVSEIRQQFFDFFESKGHQIVSSAPMVVKNDPTLMFTNAGMNQFKDFFLGYQTPQQRRVANSQKCLRVSGKHNDLEEVGVDTYHHTMFEMLGNWSFGDYFKEEAIGWAWELLTKVYQIPVDRLYVTVFEGDQKDGVPQDTESINIWKKWIAEERIIMASKKDNFWEMGDTGPCGPCTEIHVDLRSEAERQQTAGKTLVNQDHPQVIEIWNNVFMEFNRKADGSLEPLPAKHVDTGMGLERLAMALQGKQSNYDTDLFQALIQSVVKVSGVSYGQHETTDIALRVIADHIRAIAFSIADGQLPANNGAGYVIRRILRRAVRYYFSYLDYKKPLLHDLVPVLAAQFADVFPELKAQEEFVRKVVFEEENNFLNTLEKGLRKMDDIIASKQKNINGESAFELYDTYGFPLDLTQLIAQENNLTVDEEGFKAEMQKQKNRSRNATELNVDDWITVQETDVQSSFIGYSEKECTTNIIKYRKIKSKGKEQYQIVLQQTPFYAESGGQIGDTGILEFANGIIEIVDTKKENDLIIHFADAILDNVSGELVAKIDQSRRRKIMRHHTATHLLQAALQQVLGKHIAQKGSLNSSDYMRFDFSHFAKVTDEEIAMVEKIVNQKIRQNISVVTKEMSKDEAMALGAMALFGEKYGDKVRVVIIDPKFSIELCGGTHVGSTGELGIFKITSEGAVAAGVRRIEAMAGCKAEAFINAQLKQLNAIKTQFKNPKDLVGAVQQLQDEKNALQKSMERMEAKMLVGIRNELIQQVEFVNGVNVISAIVEVSSPEALRKLTMDFKNELKDYLIILATNIGGKPSVAVMLDDKIATDKNIDAQGIIKNHISGIIQGGGGGQKLFAQAGGQDASNLEKVVAVAKGLV